MIGKKNIVFGLFVFIFSAGVGPYMLIKQFPDLGKAQNSRKDTMNQLQKLSEEDFVDPQTKKEFTPVKLAIELHKGLAAINGEVIARSQIEQLRGGPHTHGNLESLLNIVIGLLLCFLAAPTLYKQLISWLFIAGTTLHAGMLYLAAYPPIASAWAQTILGWGVGPIALLLGLLLTLVAAVLWLKPEVVRD